MFRKLQVVMLAMALLTFGCNQPKGEEVVLMSVDLGDLNVVDISEMPSELLPEINYLVLDFDENYAYTFMDKVAYKDGKFYILDFRARQVDVFDNEGKEIFVLSRLGRGPQEYLQVSDFDIDSDGGFWILDAQKDVILHYLADGTFVSSVETGMEFSFIKYIEGGNLLLSVASWSDKAKTTKAVLADTCMKIRERYSYGSLEQDPDMTFASFGFCTAGSRSYCVSDGIDDDVAVFDSKGGFEGVIRYDFGSRSVPLEARLAVEQHMDDFDNYSFVSKSSVILDKDIILGSFVEGFTYNEFVLDSATKTLYKQGDASHGLFLMGVSGGKILYTLLPDMEEVSYPSLPPEVRDAYFAGETILAYRNIE